MKTTAIVLAGGSGSRMNSKVKQAVSLCSGSIRCSGIRLLCWEKSSRIDEIILVCGKGEQQQCKALFRGYLRVSKDCMCDRRRKRTLSFGV